MLAFVDEKMLTKIAEVFGNEEAIKIVGVLRNVDETTDDQIADKTEIRLNIVRRILYKLYDYSLVGLRRARDQNTGWFIFHWRLQPDQLEGFIQNQKRRVLEKLQGRLNYEKDHDFYYCSTPGCNKVPFEDAMEIVFQCPTCSKPLMHYENGEIVEVLARKVEQLRKELSE